MKIPFVFYLTAVFFVITGCRSVEPVIHTTTRTVTETLRDTTVIVAPDSATVQALFECDSLNQVVMTELSVEKGRKVNPQVTWRDKILKVAVPVDSQAVYLRLRERYESVVDTIVVYQKAPDSKSGKLKTGIKQTIFAGIILLFAGVFFRIIRK